MRRFFARIRIPRWLLLILAPVILVLAGSVVLRHFAFVCLFAATIWNAETSIKGWMLYGLKLTAAVWIVVGITSYEIFFWFVLFNKIESGLGKYVNIDIKGLETGTSRIARCYQWLKKKRFLYVVLPVFGLWPKGSWSGIWFSQMTNLNQIASFFLVALGNAAKMFLAGRIVLHMSWPWVLVSFFTFLAFPLIQKFRSRFKRTPA